ncbi:MAG: glycosyltransferase family 4 protein [Caldisericia bacterium]
MKILFIYQYLSIGGVETIIKNRIKFFPDTIKVDLLFLYKISSIEIFEGLNINKIYIEKNLKKIKNITIENKYDYIISIDTPQIHEILDNINEKTKIILEVHTGYYENREYIRRKNIPKNTKLIIVPSKSFKNIIQEELNNYIIPIYELPNCVDEIFFNEYEFKFSKIMSIPILWVGRLDSLKNWFELLKIFKILIEIMKDNNFELVIVGGYKSNKIDIDNFKNLLEKYELLDKIIWLPYINYNNMPKLYKMVSCRGGFFISTSKSESFGMTVAESMATGCPILASNIDVHRELLDEGKGGFLYELGNVDDAINNIKILINNKDLKNEKVIYSCNKAKREFDPINHTEKFLNIITRDN